MSCLLVNADALRIPLPDEVIHCVVTSPPYWSLRDYGVEGQLGLEPAPDEYIANLVAAFREVKRVLREDGTLWLNLGDSYAGAGYSNHANTGGAQRSESGKQRHTPAGGFVNGGCASWTTRASSAPRTAVNGFKPKDLCGIPWRVALALHADGWWLRSDVIWHKPNPMPESVKDRPTQSHEYLFLLSKSGQYFYDAVAVLEPCQSGPSDIRKMVERRERIGGKHKELVDPLSKASAATNIGRRRSVGSPTGRNRRTVWTIPTIGYPGAHFATFPQALVEPCIKAGTSAHGICPACGAPWERVTHSQFSPQLDIRDPKKLVRDPAGLDASSGWAGSRRGANRTETIGFLPTCACYGGAEIPRCPPLPDDAEAPQYCDICGGAGEVELWGFAHGEAVTCRACKGQGMIREPNPVWLQWEANCAAINAERAGLVEGYTDRPTVPAVVLDPFVGSGTALVVARRLGRHGIGLDLSFPYLREQARQRLELDRLEAWGELQKPGADLDLAGLPLFAIREDRARSPE